MFFIIQDFLPKHEIAAYEGGDFILHVSYFLLEPKNVRVESNSENRMELKKRKEKKRPGKGKGKEVKEEKATTGQNSSFNFCFYHDIFFFDLLIPMVFL